MFFSCAVALKEDPTHALDFIKFFVSYARNITVSFLNNPSENILNFVNYLAELTS